ncbi:MAG: hypothetical protein JSU86_08705 [Phycisphaerales bacterium]|nr:MAG: hypothetical protein JSU86_08705 [Phycisphaerales bacterium]
MASALRKGTREQKEAELANVVAWLVTRANINNVDLTKALEAKYAKGCPGSAHLASTRNPRA